PDRSNQLLGEPARERVRALVRVEPGDDVELRRDVGHRIANPRARFRGHRPEAPGSSPGARSPDALSPGSLACMARACSTSPSASAMIAEVGACRAAEAASSSTTELTVT